ncbi:MAG TPA: hypothetical protein VFW19_04200 [Allosphingosinicella sp.]|nr:hypothetical protein [Allosphingosinicella sp.]
MNRMLLNASVCGLVLIFAGCGAAGGEEAASFVKAGQALEAKVGAPGAKSDMPAADDPDVRAFNAAAEKALIDLGTPAMRVDGLGSYDRLCGSVAKITAAYLSAGVGPVGDGGLPMNDQAKVAKMTENANRYMEQLFVPLLYSAHCTAVHLPAIEKDITDRDVHEKADAMAKIRNGAYGQAAGLLQMAGSGDIPADKRKRILDLLARDGANFGIAFGPDQKQALVQGAQQIGAALPDAKAQTDRFATDLRKTPCGKLCAI